MNIENHKKLDSLKLKPTINIEDFDEKTEKDDTDGILTNLNTINKVKKTKVIPKALLCLEDDDEENHITDLNTLGKKKNKSCNVIEIALNSTKNMNSKKFNFGLENDFILDLIEESKLLKKVKQKTSSIQLGTRNILLKILSENVNDLVKHKFINTELEKDYEIEKEKFRLQSLNNSLRNDDDEEEKILLSKSRVKIKSKTIKKMGLVCKITTNVMNKRISTNFYGTGNLEKPKEMKIKIDKEGEENLFLSENKLSMVENISHRDIPQMKLSDYDKNILAQQEQLSPILQNNTLQDEKLLNINGNLKKSYFYEKEKEKDHKDSSGIFHFKKNSENFGSIKEESDDEEKKEIVEIQDKEEIDGLNIINQDSTYEDKEVVSVKKRSSIVKFTFESQNQSQRKSRSDYSSSDFAELKVDSKEIKDNKENKDSKESYDANEPEKEKKSVHKKSSFAFSIEDKKKDNDSPPHLIQSNKKSKRSKNISKCASDYSSEVSDYECFKNETNNLAPIVSAIEIEKESIQLTMQNLIDQYYIDIKDNISENYEDYVVNNMTIISYLDKILQKKQMKPPELSPEDLKKVESFDRNKKLLFLDLDETLIHADINAEYGLEDSHLIKLEIDGEINEFMIFIRPFTNEFLQYTSENFNLILFTAGIKGYADAIIDYLDPMGKFFKLKLYRDSCIQFQNFFLKDLNVIPGFDVKDMILLDNCLFSFATNLNNGILIPSYYKNPDDKELVNVTDFLDEKIKISDNCCQTNEEYFNFNSIKEFLYNKLIEEGVITEDT